MVNQWENVVSARKFSWVDLKNKVHLFVAGVIYNKLEYVMKRIREEGYVPDTDFALVDVEKE